MWQMLLWRSPAWAMVIQKSRWIELLQAIENLHTVWKFYLHRVDPYPEARRAQARQTCFILGPLDSAWVGVPPLVEHVSHWAHLIPFGCVSPTFMGCASCWVSLDSSGSAFSGLLELSFITHASITHKDYHRH